MLASDLAEDIRSKNLRRAASSLVQAYASDVLATCVAMVRDRAAAEDLAQEVFGDAIRGLSSFRGDASPRTWLLSIARNRCIDHLRARKREPWGGVGDQRGADPDEHPDAAAFGSEWFADRSLVMRALEALAEGDRALVVLRFKNGLDYDELASAFGLREGTVRMRVSRALARMRQVLEADAPRASASAPSSSGGAPSPADAARRASAPLAEVEAPRVLAEAAPDTGRAAAMATAGRPVGALGAVLAEDDHGPPSSFAARLAALVAALPS